MRCNGCHREITGTCVQALGASWHPEHFLCPHLPRVIRTHRRKQSRAGVNPAACASASDRKTRVQFLQL